MRSGEEIHFSVSLQDVDVETPDERSVMTYVAQFLHKYPELRSDTGDLLSTVQTEYNSLTQWLVDRNHYLLHLRQTNSLSNNYQVSNEYTTIFISKRNSNISKRNNLTNRTLCQHFKIIVFTNTLFFTIVGVVWQINGVLTVTGRREFFLQIMNQMVAIYNNNIFLTKIFHTSWYNIQS